MSLAPSAVYAIVAPAAGTVGAAGFPLLLPQPLLMSAAVARTVDVARQTAARPHFRREIGNARIQKTGVPLKRFTLEPVQQECPARSVRLE